MHAATSARSAAAPTLAAAGAADHRERPGAQPTGSSARASRRRPAAQRLLPGERGGRTSARGPDEGQRIIPWQACSPTRSMLWEHLPGARYPSSCKRRCTPGTGDIARLRDGQESCSRVARIGPVMPECDSCRRGAAGLPGAAGDNRSGTEHSFFETDLEPPFPSPDPRRWRLRRGCLPPLASDFPSRPVTLILPFMPGGAADITAAAPSGRRLVPLLGQPAVIDNCPGAGGIVATRRCWARRPMATRCSLMSKCHRGERAPGAQAAL